MLRNFLIRMVFQSCLCVAAAAAATCSAQTNSASAQGLPLYYWRQPNFVNFGDFISLKLVERIVEGPVNVYSRRPNYSAKKLLAIGSLLSFATTGDVIWGTGINGKLLKKSDYPFTQLDIRAVRGPLTRQFFMQELGMACPEVYGDPALLFPYIFPEFKKSQSPQYDVIIIPHYSEMKLFPKSRYPNAVYPTEPWDEVLMKILKSKFVISSSLHGIILAEAYGIPARWLRVTEHEPVFKYFDYYLGTGRGRSFYASSIEEALSMGGEAPCRVDLKKLYDAFPFEYWPGLAPKKISFE